MGKVGRPSAVFTGIPYSEWLAKGCPQLKLSVTQLATWLVPPVSRQRMNTLVHNEQVIREDGYVDTNNPRNLDFLKSWTSRVPPVPGIHVEGVEPKVKKRIRTVTEKKPRKPPTNKKKSVDKPTPAETDWTDGIPGLKSAASSLPTFDIEAILDAINNNHLNTLNGADVQKVQRLESALKTRVEREAKRGVLIDRRLVQVVFGKLWQIDSNQWKTISAKLSADIAGEFGVEDVAVLLRIEQKIDKEVNRILEHVKRLIDDFLVGVGGEAIGGTNV